MLLSLLFREVHCANFAMILASVNCTECSGLSPRSWIRSVRIGFRCALQRYIDNAGFVELQPGVPRAFMSKTAEETAHRPWQLPAGPWLMEQSWHDLLFAHWPVPFRP
jgi:hypothetical protein